MGKVEARNGWISASAICVAGTLSDAGGSWSVDAGVITALDEGRLGFLMKWNRFQISSGNLNRYSYRNRNMYLFFFQRWQSNLIGSASEMEISRMTGITLFLYPDYRLLQKK